jgi:hypothetical protein
MFNANPMFGDPGSMMALSSTLTSKSEALVDKLAGFATYIPFSIAFPHINIGDAPKPIQPPSPNLITVNWTTPPQPGAFSQKPPDVSQLFPGQMVATEPTLNFGTAPAQFQGSIPAAPSVDLNFTYPTPVISLPTAPNLLSLDVLSFSVYDIPDFTGTVPTLTISAPTPLQWSEGWTYTSDMLALMQGEIRRALTDDTDIGLSAPVQQAMWDAAREREMRNQAAAIASLEQMENMGFALPHGVYFDARLKLLTETNYVMTGLSRDIMVKQADLRLQNVTKVREIAVSLEGQLITYANNVQQRAFEAAKVQTEAAIQIYNAQVQAFSARIEGFKATVQAYDTLIKGIEAKIAQQRAFIDYEHAKVEINTALVSQYKAEIDASLATLEIAKTQVQIIQTQAQVEKLKVDTYSAQIQAFVGTVNAYTAQVEAYKANAQAQGVIEGVYKTQVEAYTARVQAGTAQAQALIGGYEAQVKGYEAQLEGYKASLQAMVEQARAGAEYNTAVTEEYKAEVQAMATFNEALIKEWQAVITANLQITEVQTKVAEANVQLQISQRQIMAEAIKGAASVMAQLGAAALGAIHWSSSSTWNDSGSNSTSGSVSSSLVEEHIYSASA